jgi:hypothetical protein
MEVQMTDFENAAFAVFIVLLSRAILSFKLNFYIPISKVKTEDGITTLLGALTIDIGRRKYANCPAERRSVDQKVPLPQRCFSPEWIFSQRLTLFRRGFLQSFERQEVAKLFHTAPTPRRGPGAWCSGQGVHPDDS